MQNGATKSRMNTLLRILFATPLTLFGCLFYLVTPLIGSGVHLDPMPGMGMLFAGVAIVVMLGGYWPIRSEKGADILANIIDVILVLGALSLVYGVALWGYETIYRVQSSELGHSRPGEVLFRVSYGTLSVAGFAVFHYWVRKASISSQP
jgi:hypothetical protein